MIRATYNLAFGLAIAVGGPPAYLWARIKRPRYCTILRRRLGGTADLPAPPPHRPLWLHGVSLGEIRALRPLVQAWARTHPQRPLLVSSSTETGLDAAADLYGPGASVTPFPVDTPRAVRALLDYWRPACVAICETELWPNFFWTCADRGIPLCLISGRIGERTLRRSRWVRPLWQSVLACGHTFAMQTEEDAARLRRLGALPDRIRVLGNLKWDGAAVPTAETVEDWRRAWGVARNTPVLLWGSTHAPEERLALDTWRILRRKHATLRLCVAPRHPERFDIVAKELATPDLRFHRRSAGPADQWDVLLLDTLGELAQLYRAATVAIVGGTFAPVGGHNILEPLAAGVPVLVGPHIKNIRDLVRTAAAGDALRQTTPDDVAHAVDRLLSDPAACHALTENGRQLFATHRGATTRILDLLDQLWPIPEPCEP